VYDETGHSIRLLGQAALVRKLAGTGRPVSTQSKKRDSTSDEGDVMQEPFPARSAIPPSAVPESGIAQTVRYNPMEIHRLLGGRKLADYVVLSSIGTGLTVNNNTDVHPGGVDLTLGTVSNQTCRKRNRKATKSTRRLQKVCMDIGYGANAGPGGAQYCLILVDGYSSQSFIYGLNGLTGVEIQDALWRFFIDAGGFPETIQCDYDPRFLGGVVRRLLHSKRICIKSSPPYRQSQNGLVERTWAVVCRMARAFLTEAQLPRSYWYWAVREASRRLNVCPLSRPTESPTTPFALFYGRKPDYRILFPFGSIGYYRHETNAAFEAESRPGIALGRSDYTNGIVFYNPATHSFSVSSDYTMDSHKDIRTHFPRVIYDGGFDELSLLSQRAREVSPYAPGESVYAYLEEESITVTGIVVTCPTKRHTYYKIRLEDNTTLQASPEAVWNDNDAAYMASEFDPRNREDDPMAPSWISEGCGITLKTDDGYKRGTLTNDEDDGGWLLHVCQADVKEGDPTHYPVADLTATWRRRMMERILIPGWPADPATAEMSAWLQLSAASTDEVDDAERDGGVFNGRIHHARTATEATVSQPPLGTARIVSAKGLKSRIAPRNLREALALHNPDHPVWLGSMNTFTEITEEQMQQYKKQGCEVVPSMSIFTVKPDEKGEPYRAKARTVVLGNLERRTWTKEDKYAPVLGHLGARLLAAEATSKGRRLKHGDCKNAFCQPDLPDDEIVIVIPPKGCPYTKIGTYWKLNKTLYGLTCSPRHWFEKLTAALKEVGFVATAHDPCLWRTHPTDGTAPVFVGIYVDDFAYFSVDDAQERWFEREMNTRFKVDFMGDVNYFLGCRYDWIDEADGSLSVHISQEGFVDALLERYDMSDCRPASTPYRSGLPIDRVPRDANLTPHQREELRTQMQSILGSTT
jgi:hypothetical protein